MLSKRQNNNRKFPSGSSPRPDLSSAKRAEAKERQAYSDSLTPEQKLAVLNNVKPASNAERCGGDAKKVRAKLATLLTKKHTSPATLAVPTAATAPDQEIENNGKKRLKAKDRRAMESQNSDEEEYDVE